MPAISTCLATFVFVIIIIIHVSLLITNTLEYNYDNGEYAVDPTMYILALSVSLLLTCWLCFWQYDQRKSLQKKLAREIQYKKNWSISRKK